MFFECLGVCFEGVQEGVVELIFDCSYDLGGDHIFIVLFVGVHLV